MVKRGGEPDTNIAESDLQKEWKHNTKSRTQLVQALMTRAIKHKRLFEEQMRSRPQNAKYAYSILSKLSMMSSYMRVGACSF